MPYQLRRVHLSSASIEYNRVLLYFPRRWKPTETKGKEARWRQERGRAGEVRGGDAKVGSFYTSRLARVVPGGMGGAKFTRSGRTDKPNATIIGAELLGLG